MKIFTEKEAEDFLENNEFKVAKRELLTKKEDIEEAVKKIKFPWVMKISSKHIIHKAKIGGTILNINTLNKAKESWDNLKEINHFEGILIQEMILGKEIILGLKKRPGEMEF